MVFLINGRNFILYIFIGNSLHSHGFRLHRQLFYLTLYILSCDIIQWHFIHLSKKGLFCCKLFLRLQIFKIRIKFRKSTSHERMRTRRRMMAEAEALSSGTDPPPPSFSWAFVLSPSPSLSLCVKGGMLFIALSLSCPRFPPTLGLAYYTSEKKNQSMSTGGFLTDFPDRSSYGLIIARVSSTAKWNEAS